MHSKNLVWTDVKEANFVLVVAKFGSFFKGIDLDSVKQVTLLFTPPTPHGITSPTHAPTAPTHHLTSAAR